MNPSGGPHQPHGYYDASGGHGHFYPRGDAYLDVPHSPYTPDTPTYVDSNGPGTPRDYNFPEPDGISPAGPIDYHKAYIQNAKKHQSLYAPPEKVSPEPTPLPSETSMTALVPNSVVAHKVQRLDYADGLRGLAALMIFNINFMDNTFRTSHPDVVNPETAPGILRSPMGLPLLFMISGRVNVTSWFRFKAAGHAIEWGALPDAIIRRTLRLLIVASSWEVIQKIECGAGAFKRTYEAELFLQTGVLKYPQWCRLDDSLFSEDPSNWNIYTTFQDILSGVIRLATNRNYDQQSAGSGLLWSMFPQVWGMIFVMMLLPIVMFMDGSRRFALYGALMVGMGWTYSGNLPFLIGMMAADLSSSRYLKKFQTKARWLYITLEFVMAAFLTTTICYHPIISAIDNALGSITNRDGKLGYTASAPSTGSMPGPLLQASLLFLWLEMSPVLQWLVSNFLFKALGRRAIGFYCAQMTMIYGLMPHLTLHFRDQGYTFFDNMWSTWALTFFSTYAVAWLTGKTLDRAAIAFSLWFSQKLQTRSSLGMLTDAGLVVFDTLAYGPGRFVRAVPGWCSHKWARTKHLTWTLFNWRGFVQPPPFPTHPGEVGLKFKDLHSTLFDADISDDVQAVRTRRILRVLSFMGPVQVCIILGLGATWMFFNPWHDFVLDGFADFSTLWRVLWALALPYCIITTLGFATPDITRTPEQQKNRKVVREHIHRLFIVSVTRGSNPETTRRAHSQLKQLEKYHPAVRVVVLTDEPYAYPDLDNIVTPKNYNSATGKAKHKAKALDYFRTTMNLTPYDWILHMDEESTMDAESLRGCFDFVRYNDAHIGQGIITYNGKRETYWKNWFFAVADCIRVGDELARFSLQTNIIKRPVFGVHGSFLFINGDVENQVTWDFGSLAEDFEFSQAAWAKGYSVGRIHGVVREQSPEGWQDFLKQRRRWYMGIREIDGLYFLPQIAIKLWTAGIFCLVATIINIPFSLLLDSSGATPRWLYVISCFCFGNLYWLYYSGLFFSEIDYGYELSEMWKIPVHAIALFFIQPIMSFFEGCAVIFAMSTEEGEVGFQVIKK